MIQNYRKQLAQLRDSHFTSDNLRSNTLQTIRCFTNSVDKLIVAIFENNIEIDEDGICLVAVGGYGRNELCPYSDIDILVIHEGDHKETKIARFVRALWDTGFPLGCVVRSIAECRKILGEDLATDTALLEPRYLCGNSLLLHKLIHGVIRPYFGKRNAWFLSEIDLTLKNGLFASASTFYVVEPDLKNGICTLRDSQRLFWSYRVSERLFTTSKLQDQVPLTEPNKTQFLQSYEYLLQIRCNLHITAGKRIDILEFSFQNSVAERMGLGPNGAGLLMEHYFKTVSNIRYNLLSYLEHRSNGTTIIEKIRRNISSVKISKKIFLLDGILYSSEEKPSCGTTIHGWIMSLFETCLSYQANLSVQLQSTIRNLLRETNETIDQTIFTRFSVLLSKRAPLGMIIRNMHETGFLSRIIPEFENLRCKVEYDSYHEFTVDQHTLMAISTVDTLDSNRENGIGNITLSAADLGLLRLAILLHDIGKSVPGNHSINGSAIASRFLAKTTLASADKNRLTFLVRHHLDLSNLSFRRRPEDHVFNDFARHITDRKNLDLLYLLTIADIKSVGHKTWTEWKGTVLHETYCHLLSLIEKTAYSRTSSLKGSPKYNYTNDQLKHLSEVSTSEQLTLTIQELAGFEQLTVYGLDRPHFFEDIVGCLSSEGYNILSASIFTTMEGKVLDIFQLEPDFVVSIKSDQRIANIQKKWQMIAKGSKTAQFFIDERLRKYPRKAFRGTTQSNILATIDNSISPDYTVIEVKSPDRFALLYRISHCLNSLNINIVSAKLSTLISLVNDVFYVCGPDGGKIEKPAQITEIKEKLTLVLSS